MLEVSNLKFSYTKNEYILKDVNLKLDEGKIYILLGKNGAGKTTLLKCLFGMFEINSGKIKSKTSPILIEDAPKLYYFLTGKEYLELILALGENVDQTKVYQLVDDLNLTNELDKSIIDYSLGMKHKLALISAIILDYQLFLLDEPLTALDPETSRFMINYFKSMVKSGKTLMISTHMMHVAYELADEVLILLDGKIHHLVNDFPSFQDFENYVIDRLKVKL